jgi:hypothetical protein
MSEIFNISEKTIINNDRQRTVIIKFIPKAKDILKLRCLSVVIDKMSFLITLIFRLSFGNKIVRKFSTPN